MRLSNFIQLQGPFRANVNLINVVDSIDSSRNRISHFGVQAKPGTEIYILDESVSALGRSNHLVVGETGILEFDDVDIKWISFLKNQSSKTLIDLIIS